MIQSTHLYGLRSDPPTSSWPSCRRARLGPREREPDPDCGLLFFEDAPAGRSISTCAAASRHPRACPSASCGRAWAGTPKTRRGEPAGDAAAAPLVVAGKAAQRGSAALRRLSREGQPSRGSRRVACARRATRPTASWRRWPEIGLVSRKPPEPCSPGIASVSGSSWPIGPWDIAEHLGSPAGRVGA